MKNDFRLHKNMTLGTSTGLLGKEVTKKAIFESFQNNQLGKRDGLTDFGALSLGYLQALSCICLHINMTWAWLKLSFFKTYVYAIYT